MIRLSRLNGDILLVNPHSIRTVARLGPNSSVRFGDGSAVVVEESTEVVAERVAEWERGVVAEAFRALRPPPPVEGSDVAGPSAPAEVPRPGPSRGGLRLVR